MNTGSMGKSFKDAQQQGDDKTSQMKRSKATHSHHKITDSNAKQSELLRPKVVAVCKKPKSVVLTKTGDGVKLSKLKSPVRVKPHINQVPSRAPQPSIRGDKRLGPTVESPKKYTMKVLSADANEMVGPSKKKDSVKTKNKIEEHAHPVENKEVQPESNGKSSEPQQVLENNQNKKIGKETPVEIEVIDVTPEKKDNGAEPEKEESKEEILNSNDKNDDEPLSNLPVNEEIETNEELKISLSVTPVPSAETSKSDEVVESTTSEPLPQDPSSQEQVNLENLEEALKDDPSFVSYDSSIMLKDVKIKLNDCLRENSKMMDSIDENTSISEAFRDLSFGKTLRTISGRSSIGRLRHVTLRQRQMSPNDSLFVNTSSVSMSQDEPSRRFASELSDSLCNTSLLERKRRIDSDMEPSAKKAKTEDGGFFNTSLEYLKNLRRPIQISTPNAREFKFDINEKSIVNDDTANITLDETAEPKKWCILM